MPETRLSLLFLLLVPKHTPNQNKPFFLFFSPLSPRFSGGRAGEPVPLASALHHLRRLCAGGGPVVHAERHQLATPPDPFSLQRKSCPPPSPQCSGCFPCLPQPVMLSLRHSRSHVVKRVHEWHHSQRHPLPALPALPLIPLLIPSSLSFFPQSLEDLEEAKRKKKKEKMGLGSLSRVFTRGKQRKSLDPGLFDGTSTPEYYIEEDADW